MSAKQKSFEVMVGALTDDLYRFAYWLCGDPHLAQDLVQETLLRAWRSLDKLRDARAVKSWLITTLRREYARTFERKRPPLVDVDTVAVESGAITGPDDDAEAALMRRHIMALGVEYREPLALQVLLGYSVAEIAGLMELTESAVMTRLFRARKKILARLETSTDAGGGEVSKS